MKAVGAGEDPIIRQHVLGSFSCSLELQGTGMQELKFHVCSSSFIPPFDDVLLCIGVPLFSVAQRSWGDMHVLRTWAALQ